MKTLRSIRDELADLGLLQAMVEVYGEVALERMNRVRQGVLYSRWFLEQLESIFSQARASYEHKLAEEKRLGVSPKKKVTMLSHNGLTVAVLIAAKTRLYGDIIRKTYELFIEDVKKGSEATIIGSVGVAMFKEEMGNKPYTEFELPDDRIDTPAFNEILKHLVQYEEIHVYYGKYKNVITQVPSVYTVSATTLGRAEAQPYEPYLFEPSLEAVLAFFEREIFATLFDQTVRESQLAKFAARMVAMDRAGEAAKDRSKMTQKEYSQMQQTIAGKKQLAALIPVIRSFYSANL